MKEKQKLTDTAADETPPQQSSHSTENENIRTNANNKAKDEAASKRNMTERARKSFHNDGPGGNYAGY